MISENKLNIETVRHNHAMMVSNDNMGAYVQASQDFDRWLARHDDKVRSDYEERRQPGPILVENIDGQRAKEWIAAELAAAKAEAWDEGQKSGLRYAHRAIRAHEMGRPDLPGPPSPNPYRADQVEGE